MSFAHQIYKSYFLKKIKAEFGFVRFYRDVFYNFLIRRNQSAFSLHRFLKTFSKNVLFHRFANFFYPSIRLLII